MGNIVGENFNDYVINQVAVRQKILGSVNRNNEQLVWENSKTGFVKLISSTNLTSNFPSGSSVSSFSTGADLATKYVLFNGVSDDLSFDPSPIETLQRSGIDFSPPSNNYGVYGLGSPEWGFGPMPGIISANIKTETRGSLKTGTVQIKAYNKVQFDIISTLYLRLGYLMLLEWGNTSYFDNKEQFVNDNYYSLSDAFLTKKYPNQISKILNTEVVTYNNLLKAIEIQREKSDANYDALLGKVVNFNWVFNKDGSYDITVIIRSIGDVIESLKVNIILPGETKLPSSNNSSDSSQPSNQTEDVIVSYAQSSTLGKKFSDVQTIISTGTDPSTGGFIENPPNQNPVTFTTPYKPKGSSFIDYFSQEYNNGAVLGGLNQYYIRFGTLLELLENIIIPEVEGSGKLLNFNTNPNTNIIHTLNKQVSSDPRICIISKTITNYNNETVKLYPDVESFTNGNGDGKLMMVYFNMMFVLKKLDSLKDKNGNVVLIDFLNSLIRGFCTATGNYNDITTRINLDTGEVVFIDQTSLPNRNLYTLNKNTAKFNIYGFGENLSGSFIRDIQLQTSITPELATMITIGATADGYVVGSDATVLSNLNKGTQDRIKPKVLSPPSAKRQSEIDNNNVETVYKTNQEAFDNFVYQTSPKENVSSYAGTLPPSWNEDLYSTFTNTQIQLLEYEQKQITISERLANSYASSPNNGFLPFNLSLTLDGLSGIKIYQRFEIDSRFLPTNYPESMEFIITGVNNVIQNNVWTTSLTSLATPKIPSKRNTTKKSQVTPTTTSTGTKQLTTQEETNAYLIDLLKKLNLPTTEGNILFFKAWREFEASAATWNAFNTRYNIGTTTNYNSVGVKNYDSRENGLSANALTFQKSDYSSLLSKLKNVTTIQQAYNVAVSESDGPSNGGLYVWSQGYYKERARQCEEYKKPGHGNLTPLQIKNIELYKGCPVLKDIKETYVSLKLREWISLGYTLSSQVKIKNLIYKV